MVSDRSWVGGGGRRREMFDHVEEERKARMYMPVFLFPSPPNKRKRRERDKAKMTYFKRCRFPIPSSSPSSPSSPSSSPISSSLSVSFFRTKRGDTSFPAAKSAGWHNKSQTQGKFNRKEFKPGIFVPSPSSPYFAEEENRYCRGTRDDR